MAISRRCVLLLGVIELIKSNDEKTLLLARQGKGEHDNKKKKATCVDKEIPDQK